MNKETKKVKVISKNTKGGKTSKTKKGSIFKTLIDFFKNHLKLVIGFVLGLVVLLIILFSCKNASINAKAVTINGNLFTKSDFMIYLYSAKYNYFGGSLDNITDDDLNVVISDEEDITVREYLKEVAMSDIKTASAVRKLASDNNIELTEKDYEDLKKEKDSFISELGGKKEFNKFLKSNNTTEESFDKMSESDKLYKKLLSNLYGKDKLKDLTEEEINDANESYSSNYVKIKQIILATIDVNTGKSLSITAVNQKEALAKTIIADTKTVNFDDLIKKYSEDAEGKEAPYDIYYKKGELLSELEDVAFSLEVGQISKPIQTKYAIHIIQKQELDNAKLEEYYDDLREEKCIEDIKEYLDNLKIVYHDAYDKIKIK